MAKDLKRPRDANRLAKAIVDIATQDKQEESKTVKRARRGGCVGGKARASSLTPEQRAEIARKAAIARWRKSD